MANGTTGRTRPIARWAMFGVLPLLAGCASLLGATAGDPPALYDLTAPVPQNVGDTGVQLLVPTPTAVRALDTERIAAKPDVRQYAYLPDAAWVDKLPVLLQDRLIETFENVGLRGAVGRPGQSLFIDYQVVINLRAFEIAGDEAVVSFTVKLLNDANGRVRATEIITSSAPLSGMTNDAFVEALDRAMDAAFIDLTQFVLARV